MLNVADSRFQDELLAQAKRHHKIADDYEIPPEYRNNTPQRVAGALQGFKAQGLFPPFPFGSEFTREEMLLAHALKVLKAKSAKGQEQDLGAVMQGLPDTPPAHALPLLARMGVQEANSREDMQL